MGDASAGSNSAQAQGSGLGSAGGQWGSGYSGTSGGISATNPSGYVGGYTAAAGGHVDPNWSPGPAYNPNKSISGEGEFARDPAQRVSNQVPGSIGAKQIAGSGLPNGGSWGSGYAGAGESAGDFARNPAHRAGGSDYTGPVSGGSGTPGWDGYIGGGGTGNSGMGGTVYDRKDGTWSGTDQYGREMWGRVDSPEVNYGPHPADTPARGATEVSGRVKAGQLPPAILAAYKKFKSQMAAYQRARQKAIATGQPIPTPPERPAFLTNIPVGSLPPDLANIMDPNLSVSDWTQRWADMQKVTPPAAKPPAATPPMATPPAATPPSVDVPTLNDPTLGDIFGPPSRETQFGKWGMYQPGGVHPGDQGNISMGPSVGENGFGAPHW